MENSRVGYKVSNKMRTIYVFTEAGINRKLIKKIQRNIYSTNPSGFGMKMVSYNNKWYYIHKGFANLENKHPNGDYKFMYNKICIYVGKG